MILISLFSLCPGNAQQLACDGSFFVATVNSVRSKLYQIRQDTAGNTFVIQEIPLSDPSRRISCLGFSIADLYLYALDLDNYSLLRIDAGGHIEDLGVPSSLNTADYEFWAGEIGPGGRTFVVVGRSKTQGFDRIVYSINLFDSDHYAGGVSVISDIPVAITDIATDPFTSINYGFDTQTGRLVTIGTGQVSTYVHPSIQPRLGSLFFNSQADLLGYGHSGSSVSETIIFNIDKIEGLAQNSGSGPAGTFTDGCSCPFWMEFTRWIEPPEVPPCGEITIYYRIRNHSGQGRLGGTFLDELPEPFTITEIVEINSTLYTMLSGPGSNRLELINFDMLLGENTIVLKAVAGPEAEGEYITQASVDNLPLGLGSILHSDDPSTSFKGDPNLIRIISSDELELENSLEYSCDGDTAFLHLPVAANSYLWSDGSTAPVLPVTESGLYWVEAESDCFVFRDSIVVDHSSEPFFVDLGEDRHVKFGEQVFLSYTSNSTEIRSQRWGGLHIDRLSCDHCPSPGFTAVEEMIFFVTVTDDRGCIAHDSLAVFVDPLRRVYIPNAFSPNGDGINDRFFPQGRSGYMVAHLAVYNRWGAQVFLVGDIPLGSMEMGWDGRFQGKEQDQGIYLYHLIIRYPDLNEETFSGEFALLR